MFLYGVSNLLFLWINPTQNSQIHKYLKIPSKVKCSTLTTLQVHGLPNNYIKIWD